MKIMGTEQTKKEMIYLILLAVTVLGFFLSVYAQEKTIVAYHNELIECRQEIIDWNNGLNTQNLWGETKPMNLTLMEG